MIDKYNRPTIIEDKDQDWGNAFHTLEDLKPAPKEEKKDVKK